MLSQRQKNASINRRRLNHNSNMKQLPFFFFNFQIFASTMCALLHLYYWLSHHQRDRENSRRLEMTRTSVQPSNYESTASRFFSNVARTPTGRLRRTRTPSLADFLFRVDLPAGRRSRDIVKNFGGCTCVCILCMTTHFSLYPAFNLMLPTSLAIT